MRRGGVMQKTSLPSMWQRSLPCPSPCIPMGVSDRKWFMVRLGVSGRKWLMVRLGVSGRKWLMVRLSGRRNLYGKDGGSSLLRYSWPLSSLVRRRAVATRGRPPGPPRRRVVAEALRLRRIRIQRSRLRLRPRLTRLARGGSAGSGDPTSTTTYNGIQKGDVAVNAGESITAKGVTITSSALASGNDVLGPTACTGVTIQNNSGKELDFNIMEFKLLSPSGTIVNAGFAGSHNIIQPGALIDGGSTSGDVCFDTDLAGGGQFVVLYEPLFSSSQKREAWVNNL